ncbi:MAG: hypothetical protein ACJ73J_02290 [Actinomycetes bacterium]
MSSRGRGYGSRVESWEAEQRWGQAEDRADRSDERLVSHGVERRWVDQAAAERREVEWAATSWGALVAGATGDLVEVALSTDSTVAGRLIDSGRGWCLIDSGTRYTLVLLDQVTTFVAAARVLPEASIQRGVGAVLRRWARMREQITVELTNGNRIAGSVTEVMSDAVCVVTETESPRRVVIPLRSVVAVSGSMIVVE